MELNINLVPTTASTPETRGVITAYVGTFESARIYQVSKEAYGPKAAWRTKVCGCFKSLDREKQPYQDSRKAFRNTAQAVGMIVNQPLVWTDRPLADNGVEYIGTTGILDIIKIEILGINHVVVRFLGKAVFEDDWMPTSAETEEEERGEIVTMAKAVASDTLHEFRKAAKTHHS